MLNIKVNAVQDSKVEIGDVVYFNYKGNPTPALVIFDSKSKRVKLLDLNRCVTIYSYDDLDDLDRNLASKEVIDIFDSSDVDVVLGSSDDTVDTVDQVAADCDGDWSSCSAFRL